MQANVLTVKTRQIHPYHIVDPSPWPFFSGISAFMLMTGVAMYMHGYFLGGYLLLTGLFLLISVMSFWWRDVVREATFEGQHTKLVQAGLRIGMVLFIVSELFFFISFFWAFFHSSLAPVPEIGSVWPPLGIHCIDPWKVPLLNTILLLSSAATVTVAHNNVIASGNKQTTLNYMFATLVFALLFTCIQLFEYIHADFTMADGIYGSIFYLTTGFHGFHVIIGTAFLTVCAFRILKNHFTARHHVGFEAAIWYWHFVDVIWLFLFVTIYWWGGK